MAGKRLACTFFLLGGILYAQTAKETGLAPDVLLLARIKVKAAEYLNRQPNYTCLQTIERSRRRSPSKRYQLVDSLRLEVALVDGKELFSWPGAQQFEERELRSLVPTGAIGTGSFALHARSVFLSSFPKHSYAEEESIEGRRCARFDYSIALSGSNYYLKVGDATALVAYYGSYWVDADSLDLVRLDVLATEIPVHLGLRYVKETVEYSRLPIGDSDFLLPRRSICLLVDLEDNESRNEISYSSCRQYAGESVLSFGEPPSAESPVAAPPPTVVDLPGNVMLDLELETAIDARHSKIGDRITARLRSKLKRGREVLFEPGALASGRLLHLERVSGRVDFYVVAIRFESLESGNKRACLVADIEEFVSFSVFGSRPSLNPQSLGASIVPRSGALDAPGVGVFYVKGGMVRLDRGTRMIWRTDTESGGK